MPKPLSAIILLPMLALAVAVIGCMPLPAAPPPTPEQAAWFAKRNSQGLNFYVAPDQSEAAWTRAKLWLANYSDFKLQTIDTALLETYYPPGEAAVRWGYQVTRQQQGTGNWLFKVRAVTGNSFAAERLAIPMGQNLAYYIRTGEDCPGCGGGKLGVPNSL